MDIVYAVVTVLAWGTWLAPSQRIRFRNHHIKTFYITAANLMLTMLVVMSQGIRGVTGEVFWLPFAGGIVWAVSGYCAFHATEKMGMAKAVGVWTPLNIIVGMAWGIMLFDEFRHFDSKALLLLVVSLVMVIAGILMIVLARGEGKKSQGGKHLAFGLLAAFGAGILWGTYFIPIRMAQVSVWTASFPLAAGMFVGGSILMLLAGDPPKLERMNDYVLASLSGILWGVGNYGMLLLVKSMGTGKGFTIAQLGVVVNALVGIFWLKDPKPGTRAAVTTFIGVLLATFGGVVLGNLK